MSTIICPICNRDSDPGDTCLNEDCPYKNLLESKASPEIIDQATLENAQRDLCKEIVEQAKMSEYDRLKKQNDEIQARQRIENTIETLRTWIVFCYDHEESFIEKFCKNSSAQLIHISFSSNCVYYEWSVNNKLVAKLKDIMPIDTYLDWMAEVKK